MAHTHFYMEPNRLALAVTMGVKYYVYMFESPYEIYFLYADRTKEILDKIELSERNYLVPITSFEHCISSMCGEYNIE